MSVLSTVYFLEGSGRRSLPGADLVVEDGQGVLLVDLGAQGTQLIELTMSASAR